MIPIFAETLGRAWYSAVEAVDAQPQHHAFDVVVEISAPSAWTPVEESVRAVLTAESQARTGSKKPWPADVEAVAGTIFPIDIAARRTADELYHAYKERVFPRLQKMAHNQHGTYFERMISQWTVEDGTTLEINPLDILIDKLRNQKLKVHQSSVYELPIYRVERDAKQWRMEFPCLSHLSFKLAGNQVRLTALYRSQYFVQKLFGNLLGLARLQQFVAAETELAVGPLVCHATHAIVDSVRRDRLTHMMKRVRTVIQSADATLAVSTKG